MYTIWLIHFALLKGNYEKRKWSDRKLLESTIVGLSIGCITMFLVFLFMLFIDKQAYRDEYYHHRTPWGPIGKGMAYILLIIIGIISQLVKVKNKYHKKRKVVAVIQKTRKIHSRLYLCFYVTLFIIAILLGAKMLTE